jgi:hypothetical protein
MKLRSIWNSFWSIFARKQGGEVVIEDGDRLLRRLIFAEPWIQCDPTGKPTSAGFSLRKGERGLSVDLERLTTHAKAVSDPKTYRLCALPVSKLRALHLVCWHDPLPTNYAHSLIGRCEEAPAALQQPELLGKVKFNRTLQRALADAAIQP